MVLQLYRKSPYGNKTGVFHMKYELNKETIRKIRKRKITPGNVENQLQHKKNLLKYIKTGVYAFEDVEITLSEIDEFLKYAQENRPEFFI